jgi:RNA polymerase sigma-70 factor (ECF subfamily)
MSIDTKKANINELLYRIAEFDDKEAFKIFFNLYYTKLIKFALLFVPSKQQAEDIVSEVLIRLLKKRRQLSAIDNFEGYLFLSVKNQALSSIKKVSARISFNSIDMEGTQLSSEQVNPESIFLDDELRDLVFKTVENLPPRRKMIYKMIKDDGLKYKEVADLLAISQKTVENHLDIAIKEVRTSVTLYLKGKQVKSLLNNVPMNTLFLCLSVFCNFQVTYA